MPETLTPVSERDETGFAPLRRVSEASLTQFNDLMATEPGRVSYWLEGLRRGIATNLTEHIAPGDFPTLFGFAIQRDMQARYAINVADWRKWTKVGTLPNFNQHERHKVYGQDNQLPQVLPGAPYPDTPSGTAHYHRQVFKYGRRFDILWESVINDALGAFNDLPARFADAATRTQARNLTSVYSSAAGPNVLQFGAPIVDVDGQNVTNQGVLPFTAGNLTATLALMARQTDPNGEVIKVRGVHVVVPTSLYYTALQIMESPLLQQIAGAVALPTTNIIPRLSLQLHEDPDLEVLDVSGTGDTTWYVFAEPGESAAIGMDYLAGHVGPDIRIKSSGSGANPLDGDFDNDGISYRVRDVHGACHIDPRYCYAQVGP